MSAGQESLEEFERAISSPGEHVYVLRLYVSGASPKSTDAIRHIKAICEEHLAHHYELEVIDIYQQPWLAADGNVVAAPTLVKQLPLPLRRLIGNLSNAGRVLQSLGLSS